MTEPITPDAPPNRLPLIIGGGAGVLLLIFLLTQVFSSDDKTEPVAAPVPVTPAPVVPTPTTLVPGAVPAETFETFNTKNPFVPLRILSTAGGGGGAAATGGTAGSTTVTTRVGGTTTGGSTAVGTITGGTVTSGGTTTGGSTGGTSTEPRRGARVALLDVFAEGGKIVANVRVNDTVYKVSDGQTFATSFKVVSLSQADDCGRFVFGDDAFRLCKGEESLK